ncbi:UDP-N-acetylglucosamine 2-epimerase (non-hydrolysing) [Saccharomonospora amisosensis]|uniref:UDP-N-acetylglucosamine 2-epimerase (non-hydrolyzing) n=1 Tax=Saccharomonospora amisosensis TaxID=1128677 RepID=A0A7X5ZQM4_9PSEU|nr:UDP-N-acetylglucosamine 2-epimerase (non-hydrolyzing) [Saccharomonospora amisosensis]NIJ11425.1 UDP-N-acetylglucosamine 2-epimerase (non-hydrolysing) [Saccharomonospora amisosensis]
MKPDSTDSATSTAPVTTVPDQRTRPRLLVAYGTRPEAVKLAPLIAELRSISRLDVVVAVTGQHREMLDQVNGLFGIVPRHDLDVIQPGQSLTDITTRTLTGLRDIVEEEQPAAVVVQGDTTSAFTAALAGFYAHRPVVHLEAGLRTSNRYSPFPEEINRRLITQLTTLHLAPTPQARLNLLAEGVHAADVAVTGNTVIDALRHTVARPVPYSDPIIAAVTAGRRLVLVTAHRRESWGEPMTRIGKAIARLAAAEPDTAFVLPAHRNPDVRRALLSSLNGLPNVLVREPMSYAEFARILDECDLVLTDSGGIQEEAPSLGKPVLVLRDTSERPEALRAGTARLVGTGESDIVEAVGELLHDRDAYQAMARAVNPYGDGFAAHRAARAIEELLGIGKRATDFEPATADDEATAVAELDVEGVGR